MERTLALPEIEPILAEALLLQKEIARSTQMAQMGYIPSDLDTIAVLGHKSTFLNVEYFNKEPWANFMDTDRVTEATYFWHQIAKEKPRGQPPTFVYTGAHEECDILTNYRRQQDLLGIPCDSLFILDKVIKENGKKNHTCTADNIEALFQQLTDPKSPIHGKTNVAIASHLAHFIRIPYYLERFRQQYDPNSEIHFYPYSVLERPDTRKPFVESELEKLAQYAQSAQLAQTPIDLKFFGS